MKATGEFAEGRRMLERARDAGGDSVYAMASMAETAAGMADYVDVAAQLMRALPAVRPTIARPFPGALPNAVRLLALNAPPEIAAPVLELAARTRPSWDLAWHGGAWVYLRMGGRNCVRAAEMGSELTRFGWTDREIADLLRRCISR